MGRSSHLGRLSRALGHLQAGAQQGGDAQPQGVAADAEPTLAQRLMQSSMKPPDGGTRPAAGRSPVFGTRCMVSSSQVRVLYRGCAAAVLCDVADLTAGCYAGCCTLAACCLLPACAALCVP